MKRQRYLQHPDNLYFLLIEQKRVRVEVMARGNGWQPVVLDRLDAALDLPELGFSVRVADLYRGTPLHAALTLGFASRPDDPVERTRFATELAQTGDIPVSIERGWLDRLACREDHCRWPRACPARLTGAGAVGYAEARCLALYPMKC